MDGFGGGWIEHPRQRLGAQWDRPLPLGGPGCSGPPGAPCGGTGAELGRCQEGRFDHAGGTWPPLPVEDPAAREPGGGGAMSESRRFCSSWSHARTSSSVASAAKVWRSAPSSVRRESVLVVPEPEEGAWAWTAREARRRGRRGGGLGRVLCVQGVWGLCGARSVPGEHARGERRSSAPAADAACACWATALLLANFSARSFLSSSRRRSRAARSSWCSRFPRFSFSSSWFARGWGGRVRARVA